MKKPLKGKRLKLHAWWLSRQQQGEPPTYDEAAAHLGIKTPSVYEMVQALIKAGHMRRDRRVAKQRNVFAIVTANGAVSDAGGAPDAGKCIELVADLSIAEAKQFDALKARAVELIGSTEGVGK